MSAMIHASFFKDAMGAIASLRFSGRIPPWVVVDDRIGGGKVEAHATGFQ